MDTNSVARLALAMLDVFIAFLAVGRRFSYQRLDPKLTSRGPGVDASGMPSIPTMIAVPPLKTPIGPKTPWAHNALLLQ
jgi:hypothetical protein